jgi:hypothetical protein
MTEATVAGDNAALTGSAYAAFFRGDFPQPSRSSPRTSSGTFPGADRWRVTTADMPK